MPEYMLIFRYVPSGRHVAENKLKMWKRDWQEWINGIMDEGKLFSTNMLGPVGKVLKSSGIVTDGPFVELKEELGGNVVVKAESLEEAITLAHGCPVLSIGGNVEVRPVIHLKVV